MPTVTLLILLAVVCLIAGFFTAYLADAKGRDYLSWFILGFFFSLFALLTMVGMPKRGKKDDGPPLGMG